MNIAAVAIRKKTVTLVLTVGLIVGGIIAYQKLGRLEDPEFTIKDALVITPYPGATAAEVEEEVTNEIEKAVQQLGQLKRVVSRSQRGASTVTVTIRDKYDKYSLPQVWDELRRKVSDAQGNLPPGSGPSFVMDDYGDVFGIFLAVTGDGYTYEEIRRYVDMLRRELLLVQDVKKVDLFALHDEAVYVEMSSQKMAGMGISQERIFTVLSNKNLVADGGMVEVGAEYVPIKITGEFTSVQEIGDLLLSSPGSKSVIYLRDVATVRRGYVDPVLKKLRYNRKPAIGIAVSTVMGGNVVAMGKAMEKRLGELDALRPIGMELNIVSYQSRSVTESIQGFVVNLIEAIVIVIVVLLLFMGMRAGLIIGGVLLLTILMTMMGMQAKGIMLERISLGALILALGMLVDNAIVIIDGMLIRIQNGEDKIIAATKCVSKDMTPLLGATVIAILSFAAIGLSDDSTGEYCGSLFWVLLISLFGSWVVAVTVTPLLGVMFLKKPKLREGEENKEPFQSGFYRGYRAFLASCIRARWVTVALMCGLLGLAIFGFGFLEQNFFPPSTRPQFMIDVWMPEGTHIDKTTQAADAVSEYIREKYPDDVSNITATIGAGAPRFLLVYAPEKADSSYGQLLVDVKDYRVIGKMREELQDYLDNTFKFGDETKFPRPSCLVKTFLLGPGDGGKMQMRLRGPDGQILRSIAERTMSIMHQDPEAVGIRDDWRQKIKTVETELRQAQAMRNGIERPQIANVIEQGFSGKTVGVYRERNRLLPIIARAPDFERHDAGNIPNLQIWSPAGQKMIPISQVVSGTRTVWQNAIICRRNRLPTITVHCDPNDGRTTDMFSRIAPKIEKMFDDFKAQHHLSEEFTLEWGGEHEDTHDAQAGLAASLPAFIVMMVLIVIILFNALRQPLIIWLCVPLGIIGVTAGLLVTQQPFGFMALLGILSLTGMLIKNAIVLIDQIDLNIREDMEKYPAIISAAVSRMRPVMMAAATTVLGMIPLVLNPFYASMAVAVMAGLSFAAVLTLIFVPTLYAIFFRVKSPQRGESKK